MVQRLTHKGVRCHIEAVGRGGPNQLECDNRPRARDCLGAPFDVRRDEHLSTIVKSARSQDAGYRTYSLGFSEYLQLHASEPYLVVATSGCHDERVAGPAPPLILFTKHRGEATWDVLERLWKDLIYLLNCDRGNSDRL